MEDWRVNERGIKRKHDSISSPDDEPKSESPRPKPSGDNKKASPGRSKAKDHEVVKSAEEASGDGETSSPIKGLAGRGSQGDDADKSGGVKELGLAKLERLGSVADEESQKSKEDQAQEEREKMQVLVEAFSEEQLNRYEMFRRAAFPRAAVKRIMQSITGGTVSQNVVIAMAGIAKVYVGEIVEQGLDALEEWGESGPLQAKHIREAVRRLKSQDNFPTTKYKTSMFR
ncbi:transcription initiation factor TFIID subunit 11-like [Anneissia japonica]|uniref:transcription initiation factor TFIID subunit 11-like n=1 Tax=Anneissia japonica TaxID=1529436 RepID=UPI00142579B0|nr:transcription initiation factor TFIID subunit 11-like [Anneissia japonica]